MARGPSTSQLDAEACSCWIEVDLSALEHNIRQVQEHGAVPILPILKGDAYGHGAPVLAAFLQSKGFSLVGVSSLEEALAIIQVAPVRLLVLAPPLHNQLPLFLQHRLLPTITSPHLLVELAQLARARQQFVTVHVKVDTGFGRLGVAPDDLLPLLRQLQKEDYLRLGGIFTHFPAAFSDATGTQRQLRSFLDLKEQVEALGFQEKVLWHAANSAAFLTLPASHFDLVRIGTLLYGQSPVPGRPSWDLAETWEFKTRIIHIRTLPKGHSVGYGRLYRTKKPTRIGVIPVGYGHGLELEPLSTPLRQIKQALGQGLKGQHYVFHPQGPLAILGRVGMGLTSVDLSKTPDAQVGDVVTVAMRRVTASGHVPRFYYLQGKLRCIFWNHQILSPSGRRIGAWDLF